MDTERPPALHNKWAWPMCERKHPDNRWSRQCSLSCPASLFRNSKLEKKEVTHLLIVERANKELSSGKRMNVVVVASPRCRDSITLLLSNAVANRTRLHEFIVYADYYFIVSQVNGYSNILNDWMRDTVLDMAEWRGVEICMTKMIKWKAM